MKNLYVKLAVFEIQAHFALRDYSRNEPSGEIAQGRLHSITEQIRRAKKKLDELRAEIQ